MNSFRKEDRIKALYERLKELNDNGTPIPADVLAYLESLGVDISELSQ